MAAKKTGGGAGRTKAKNVAMASRMKAEGVERRVARCPLCHGLVGLGSLPIHIGKCGGRS